MSRDETTFILNNWVRPISQNNPNLSFTSIFNLIIQFLNTIDDLAFITNSTTKLYSCTLNLNNPKRPFYINTKKVRLSNGRHITRIHARRPNYLNQFLLETCREIRYKVDLQTIVYDFETNTVITTLNTLNFKGATFLNSDSIIFPKKWRIELMNIFDKTVTQIHTPFHRVVSCHTISDNCFYFISESQKIVLCWPWDNMKENVAINVHLRTGENFCMKSISWNDKIYVWKVDLDSFPRRSYVLVYDLNTHVWLNGIGIPVSEFTYYSIRGHGDVVVLVNSLRIGESMQVLVVDEINGTCEKMLFDWPRGFENFLGLMVVWV